MKKKKNLLAVLFCLFTTLGALNAQTINFVNNLNCDVTIFIEEWDQPSPICGICNSGPVVVPCCGGTVPITLCGTDICVDVIDVGGNGCAAPAPNHRNLLGAGCHNVAPSGQSGTSPAGCCDANFAVNWQVIWNPLTNTWTIQ